MNGLINIIEHDNELLDKVFFHGDYLADRTASGEEECGIRLWHKVDQELMKEEIEELYHLIVTASEMLQELKAVALGLENTDSDWAKERLEYVREIIAKVEGE